MKVFDMKTVYFINYLVWGAVDEVLKHTFKRNLSAIKVYTTSSLWSEISL